MKQNLKQSAISLIPLVLGCICNTLYLKSGTAMWIVNLAYPPLWACLCYWTADPARPMPGQILWLNLVSTIMLALALCVQFGAAEYLPMLLVYISQFYFLPAMVLFGRLIAPFLKTASAWYFFIAEYVGLLLLSIAAVWIKKRRPKA